MIHNRPPRTERWLLASSMLALLLSAGCYNGLLCSHRFDELAPPMPDAHASSCGCNSCRRPLEGRLKLRSVPAEEGLEQNLEAKQLSLHPPTSRFHPVPTQPVFARRTDYKSWDPLNVKMVPAEEQPTPAAHGQHGVEVERPLEPIPAPVTSMPSQMPANTTGSMRANDPWRGFAEWAESGESETARATFSEEPRLLPLLRPTNSLR